jgi:hypothetical protein
LQKIVRLFCCQLFCNFDFNMSSTNSADLLLNDAFEKFVKNVCRHYVVIDGVVDAYNEDDFTCDVKIQDTLWTSIPICVLVGSQASFFPIPVIGTNCLVGWRDGSKMLPQIIQFDQIEQLNINCQKVVQFNNGENGGIPLSPNVSDRLNKIENAYNDLVEKFNAHSHILTLTSGTGTAAPTTDQETTTLTPTQPSDIENNSITQ